MTAGTTNRANPRRRLSVRPRSGRRTGSGSLHQARTFVVVSSLLKRDAEERRWYADGAGSCFVLTRRGRLLEPFPTFGPTAYRVIAWRVSATEARAYAAEHGVRNERIVPGARAAG